MLDGLRKGTETVKANVVRVPFTCPICKRTLLVEPCVLKTKKYCSAECATKSGSWHSGVQKSAECLHERNLARKLQVKDSIINWCMSNKEAVLNCPMNAISTHLTELKQLLFEKYQIKDLRTVYICFEVKNLKSLLRALQDAVTENENVR